MDSTKETKERPGKHVHMEKVHGSENYSARVLLGSTGGHRPEQTEMEKSCG
jgi:hypothetical protein